MRSVLRKTRKIFRKEAHVIYIICKNIKLSHAYSILLRFMIHYIVYLAIQNTDNFCGLRKTGCNDILYILRYFINIYTINIRHGQYHSENK